MIDLTAVVTAHNEGRIVHKTMRSIFEALGELEKDGKKFEIIVHIDNGDKATINYFKRYENDKRVRIFRNNFGDLGTSRNFAVQQAKGKVVAFLDGDDLVSNNWYLEAIRLLYASKGEIVVHPEAVLNFGVGVRNVLTIQEDSGRKDEDTVILLGENRWCSVAAARKETFEKYPYRKMGDGYGFEDYAFNMDTLVDGVQHKIAKKTVLFYRKSGNSMLDRGNRESVVLPYVKAFDYNEIKKSDYLFEKSDDVTFKNKAYRTYKKIRNNDFLNFFITPVAKATIKILGYDSPNIKKKKNIDFVIDAWKNINHIETQLYPHKKLVKEMQYYSAENYINVGKAYVQLVRKIRYLPDYIFIVPWMVRGGAEKVVINHIDALKEIHPEWHVAVISTLPVKNTWLNKLPDDVDFIDFGNIAFGLTPEEQDKLMSRLIVQSRCKNIHINNSEYGFDWARRHKKMLGKHYNLYASLFCGEFIPGSNLKGVFSYDNPGIFEIYDSTKKIITDNATVIKKSVQNHAFDEKDFSVHYQPVRDLEFHAPKESICGDGRLHILWASRIAPAKLPELVRQIGENLSPDEYSIDVYGEMAEGMNRNMFDGVATVRYRGGFNGFSTLPINDYDVLLYTALDDGIPNIILEATMAGLPVIASNDGGVGEFVKDGETGILIEEYTKYEPFVDALSCARSNPEQLKEYVLNAQKLLKQRHSWGKFVDSVKKDVG